ncbi:hypothetical protein [Flavobacterium suzhouense]|uniref:Uncharacterized protein n=1 Tax=Flavobacterium suzhouense TaxID=1529638 RepID=A0ABW5P002_9FLAO
MRQLATLLLFAVFYIPAFAQDSIPTATETIKEDHKSFTDDDAATLPWHARRFRLMVGTFFPINNTTVKVAGNNGNIATEIDLEDDLGFQDNTTSFYANAMWRASKRSRFELEYFYLNRESSKTLEKEITFNDHTYPVNASVNAHFNTTITRFAYGYAILCKPKYEVGLLIGTHLMFIDLGMGLNTNVGSVGVSDKFKVTAPLPDLGIWSEVVITRKLGLYVNANYLSAKVDNIDGQILSYNVSLLYNVFQNLSLTAGYSGLDIDVEITKKRVNGSFDWGYNGPSLAVTYTFGNHIKFRK